MLLFLRSGFYIFLSYDLMIRKRLRRLECVESCVVLDLHAVRLRCLVDLDLLHCHVGVHGGRLLDGLGKSFVVVDGLAIALDGHLLLDPGLHVPVRLARVRRRLDGPRPRRDDLRGDDLALDPAIIGTPGGGDGRRRLLFGRGWQGLRLGRRVLLVVLELGLLGDHRHLLRVGGLLRGHRGLRQQRVYRAPRVVRLGRLLGEGGDAVRRGGRVFRRGPATSGQEGRLVILVRRGVLGVRGWRDGRGQLGGAVVHRVPLVARDRLVHDRGVGDGGHRVGGRRGRGSRRGAAVQAAVGGGLVLRSTAATSRVVDGVLVVIVGRPRGPLFAALGHHPAGAGLVPLLPVLFG